MVKKIEVNNQYIFYIEKKNYGIFYNNLNGKICFAKKIADLDEAFFEKAKDTNINLSAYNYEQLYLAISESCNFRCKYCRQSKSDKIVNMTEKEIKNAINLFFSVSSEPKSIVFFGGEPLLNKPGIKCAIDYAKKLKRNLKFSMVTNGSLCTEKDAEFLAENNVDVILSMDGPEKIHNEARINVNGKGTYKDALRGYYLLKDAGCNPGISAVIGPHNEKKFKELIEWAISLKPNTLGFCLPHGNENNYAMQLESFNKVHKEMIKSFDILHKNGIYLVQVEQKLKAFILGYSIPYECKACGSRIVICKDNRYGICEGPITKHELFYNSIDELKICISEYKKSSPFYNENCKKCIAYRVCGGGCVYDKLTRYGRCDVQDECRCGLNRMIAEKALKIISDKVEIGKTTYILNEKDREKIQKELEEITSI